MFALTLKNVPSFKKKKVRTHVSTRKRKTKKQDILPEVQEKQEVQGIFNEKSQIKEASPTTDKIDEEAQKEVAKVINLVLM